MRAYPPVSLCHIAVPTQDLKTFRITQCANATVEGASAAVPAVEQTTAVGVPTAVNVIYREELWGGFAATSTLPSVVSHHVNAASVSVTKITLAKALRVSLRPKSGNFSMVRGLLGGTVLSVMGGVLFAFSALCFFWKRIPCATSRTKASALPLGVPEFHPTGRCQSFGLAAFCAGYLPRRGMTFLATWANALLLQFRVSLSVRHDYIIHRGTLAVKGAL